MPRYEFRCEACGAVIEEHRPVGAHARPATCGCGGRATFRYSAPRVQHLTASRDSLASWGRDLRVETGAKTLAQLVREREAQRRDPEQPGRAAAID